MEVTLEQVQELVKSDETVREALKGEFVNPEAVTAFLDTEEGKKVIQPIADKRVTEGIQSWKHNNLQKLIDQAIIEANPADTPEQKRIKELEMKFKESEEKAIFAQQESYALSLATQRNLPSDLVKPFVGKTAEETLFGINQLDMAFTAAVQTAVEGHLGGTGRRSLPDNPNTQNATGTPEKKFSELSTQEKNHLYMTNRPEYERIRNAGQ
ncbi:Uncharacterized protein B5E38_4983 [Bacillus cereus]|nr:Uncharacterized protein B5E38_4983 [Bacillus cereus]ARO65070.1 Uncharacterized protein B5E39_2699 [Bacillus cereus]